MKHAEILVALLFATLLGARATAESADEKAIRAAHNRLLAAINSKKSDEVRSLLTKGFTQAANGMTLGRDQAVAQMTQGPAKTKVDWTMSGLRVTGNSASYNSNYRFATAMPANGPNDKAHIMGGTGVQKVQLVKEGGKWLYNHLQLISSTMTIDGKPFAMPSPPKTPGKP